MRNSNKMQINIANKLPATIIRYKKYLRIQIMFFFLVCFFDNCSYTDRILS